MCFDVLLFFFFKQKTAYEMRISDWSSDVCSSDLPTNKPMIRKDQSDLVYKNETAKFAQVVEDIAERHATGQPVLVGTTSVEKSEYLSRLLAKKGDRKSVV